jgi:dienelactone hydrolase
MVGYNDTNQVPHSFGGQREALWGISLMGLQLWDSIRAVDFLLSLPDVDKRRIACTGASGGGTQTFMLTAVDDRVAVSAPAVMISAHMQGGCLCENAPGLRIDTNNMEIGAMMAPRPMLMIAATGDWTKNTATVEYPAIRSVYQLFGAEDKVEYKIFTAQHNYNKDSREAMYAFFNRWLLGITDPAQAREAAFTPDQPRDLLVFYGQPRPKDQLNPAGLTKYLIGSDEEQFDAMKPKNKRGLDRFREVYGTALRRALNAEQPASSDLVVNMKGKVEAAGFKGQRLTLGRKDMGDVLPAILMMPDAKSSRPCDATLIVHPDGKDAALKHSLTKKLLQSGQIILTIDAFATGESQKPSPDPKLRLLDTYNRTLTDNRVQDILTALAYLRSREDTRAINLVGLDRAGLWCLLAAGLASPLCSVVADAAQFDTTSDDAFVADLYVPSLRRAGDFRTACTLALPASLMIHNTGGTFATSWAADVYRSLKLAPLFRVQKARASDAQIVGWIAGTGVEITAPKE